MYTACTVPNRDKVGASNRNIQGSTYPPTGPGHQISLTQITNHSSPPPKKKNSFITKLLMYYESMGSHHHAALWSCRERFTCQIYSHATNRAFYTGPITMITVHGKGCTNKYSPQHNSVANERGGRGN